MSIRTKLKVAAVSALSAGAVIGSVAFAGGASATTMNHPVPLPAACRVTPFSHDSLKLTFGTTNYTYQVRLRITPVGFRSGIALVSGTLCDTYEPVPLVLPVHGIIFGDNAVISEVYPSHGIDAGNQGTRTFSGVIGPFGHTAGVWSETGTENGSGPFVLARI